MSSKLCGSKSMRKLRKCLFSITSYKYTGERKSHPIDKNIEI